MGMKDSAKALGARFKLDSHHAIERFGVLFGVLCLSSVVIFGATGVSAFSNNKQALSSTALYTPTFTTSKTEIGGEVPGVFVNKDRTRALVLMQFEDTSQVSVNAEDYQGFLTGSSMDLDQEDLKNTVAGSVYVFGSTGYMGVMLDSTEPFTEQVMDLTMRANTELVYTEKDVAAEDEMSGGDASFQKYDQWRVFFNPGGSEATVSEALSQETVDVGAIFNELVVAAEEEDIRGRMDAQLALMKTDLNRINDGTAELGRTTADGGKLRLEPPQVPAQIAGDEVTGEPGIGETPSTLDLKTGFVLPMGYDFDWRGGSVMEGYLEGVVPEGSSFVSYLAEREAETAQDDEFRVNDMQWLLNDGSNLATDYDSSDPMIKPLSDIMNKLSLAYQDYYKDKQVYQVELHAELLNLEINLRNVESNFTKNESKDALRSY